MKTTPNNTTRSNAESVEPLLSNDTNSEVKLPPPTPTMDEWPVVFSYSRKDALADGVQVDVTETAKEAGFSIPVFLTDTVFNQYVKVPEGVECQDEAGRLWDILQVLRYAIKQTKTEESRLPFQLFVRNDNEKARLVTLHAVCGALDIDDASPSMTIMLPTED
mgnify:CR=1 FL=1